MPYLYMNFLYYLLLFNMLFNFSYISHMNLHIYLFIKITYNFIFYIFISISHEFNYSIHMKNFSSYNLKYSTNYFILLICTIFYVHMNIFIHIFNSYLNSYSIFLFFLFSHERDIIIISYEKS